MVSGRRLCIAFTAVASVLATGAPARADVVPGFASPPMSARAINRGGTTADTAATQATLTELAKAGFGAAELGYVPGADPQASLSAILAKANALGMRVDLNACGSVSCSSPAVTLATSMQQLVPFAQTVTATAAGQAFDAPPPPPAGLAGSPTLVAVTAAKVAGANGAQTLLDPATAADLTASVSDGTLHWRIPSAGTWRLFAFYSRATGQFAGFPPFIDPPGWNAMDPAGGAGRYMADIFQRQGVSDVLDAMAASAFGGGNQAQLAGSDVFHDSIEVQAEMFWTGDLPQQFQARRGYSLIKYLPVLHNWHESSFNPLNLANFSPLPPPDYDFTGDVGERVRSDFARTLTDLYVDRYVRGMNDWAHSRGLHSRQEVSYNYKQLDVIRAAAAVDVPETESFDLNWGRAYDSTLPEYPTDRWRYGVDGYRLTSSGAHIAGHDRVTMEWADDFAIWRKGPKEMADLMNAAIAGGVTQPSFAGFGGVNDAAWPTPGGLSFIGFGDILQTNWPQWRDFAPLMTYIARSTVLVESGKPRVDVTVYHDDGLSSLRDVNTPLWRGRALSRSGYTYDFVDPVDLASPAAGAVPGRLFGNYRALIIDGEAAMAPDAAVAVLHSALRGLPVVIVGAAPSRSSGLFGDGAVRIAMAALAHLRNVVQVGGEDDVPAALERLGVDPGAAFGDGDLQTVHRRTSSGDAWWLYNPTDAPISTRGSFDASGQPYLLDLWNGTTTPVAEFDARRGRTSVPVVVPAHGSIGIAFRGRAGVHATSSTAAEVVYGDHGALIARDVAGGVKSVTLSTGRTKAVRLPTLPAPLALEDWHLDVDEISPAGHTPHSLDLHGLRDWQTIPELQSAVGTSMYTAQVNVPASWLGSHREVELDLGDFVGAVRLTVNGALATQQTTPGIVVPVTALLHPGLNTIAVRLDTTLLNRNAQLRASGDPRYQTGPVPPVGQFQPTPVNPEPNGLLGPARLIPVATGEVH